MLSAMMFKRKIMSHNRKHLEVFFDGKPIGVILATENGSSAPISEVRMVDGVKIREFYKPEENHFEAVAVLCMKSILPEFDMHHKDASADTFIGHSWDLTHRRLSIKVVTEQQLAVLEKENVKAVLKGY